MFGLDPSRYAIDCDPTTLPELAQDLKDMVTAVKDAPWLTLNEKRIATGYEPLQDENMEKIYVPNGLSTLEEINVDTTLEADEDL